MNTTNAPSMVEYCTKSLDFTPHDTKWIRGSARVVCCGVSTLSKGAIRIYELEREGTKDLFHDLSFRPQGIKCATFGASQTGEQHLALGEYSGQLSICDLDRAGGEIFSASSRGFCECNRWNWRHNHWSAEIVTGRKDGSVKVWDPRVRQAVVTLNPDETTSARDCWAMAFGNSKRVFRSLLFLEQLELLCVTLVVFIHCSRKRKCLYLGLFVRVIYSCSIFLSHCIACFTRCILM